MLWQVCVKSHEGELLASFTSDRVITVSSVIRHIELQYGLSKEDIENISILKQLGKPLKVEINVIPTSKWVTILLMIKHYLFR